MHRPVEEHRGGQAPERRKPAVNVVVFQWPWGMAARHRSPLRDHPRSRAIFIDAPVSSMKISRSGASPAWPSNQSRRRASTSGRCCSAAWPAFFVRQPALGEEVPDRRRAHPNPVRRRQLLANLGQRHSLGLRHQSQDKGLMRIQPRARRLALAVGLDRSRLAPAPVPVDRRRWRDTKTRRGPPCRQTPVTASTTRRRRSFP